MKSNWKNKLQTWPHTPLSSPSIAPWSLSLHLWPSHRIYSIFLFLFLILSSFVMHMSPSCAKLSRTTASESKLSPLLPNKLFAVLSGPKQSGNLIIESMQWVMWAVSCVCVLFVCYACGSCVCVCLCVFVYVCVFCAVSVVFVKRCLLYGVCVVFCSVLWLLSWCGFVFFLYSLQASQRVWKVLKKTRSNCHSQEGYWKRVLRLGSLVLLVSWYFSLKSVQINGR